MRQDREIRESEKAKTLRKKTKRIEEVVEEVEALIDTRFFNEF